MATISFNGEHEVLLPMARRLNLWQPLMEMAEEEWAGQEAKEPGAGPGVTLDLPEILESAEEPLKAGWSS